MISNIKFRKILNDLKRRPEDAAKDLQISKNKISNILSGKNSMDFNLIKKAVKIWPVNFGDFFTFEDDTKNDFKLMRSFKSNQSSRIMHRGGKPYYLYKDTVMSKLSPFKPELITELMVVENNYANNKNVKFNNGHFLHQFTYFIGPVNFYYYQNGKKKISKMNTGDSMYISPYIQHSFTTRKNKKNVLGKILALTYSDKIDNETLNEISAIGINLAKKYRINNKTSGNYFWSNLNKFLDNSSTTIDVLQREIKNNLKKLKTQKKVPQHKIIVKIASFLNLNTRDLMPPRKNNSVKIQTYKNSKKWFYPDKKSSNYQIVELTNTSQLPYSRAYEITILRNKKNNIFLEVPTHQYIYNISDDKVKINLDNFVVTLNPQDSIYIKPNKKHNFYGKGKIVVLRIGGRISGESLQQISMITEKNLERAVKDHNQWFNK